VPNSKWHGQVQVVMVENAETLGKYEHLIPPKEQKKLMGQMF